VADAADGALSGGRELSGAIWVERFPGSRSPDDLKEPFGTAAKRFLQALDAAGADVTISATFRPPERAYLMHHCWKIAHDMEDPRNVPSMPGVDIEWAHRTASGAFGKAASRAAAQAMVDKYDMAQIAALKSRHTERRAIDMSITWSGTLTIKNASGQLVAIATTPRTGAGNAKLHQIGRSYGVIKLTSDRPHWSEDGH
jgi:hypothetical protein